MRLPRLRRPDSVVAPAGAATVVAADEQAALIVRPIKDITEAPLPDGGALPLPRRLEPTPAPAQATHRAPGHLLFSPPPPPPAPPSLAAAEEPPTAAAGRAPAELPSEQPPKPQPKTQNRPAATRAWTNLGSLAKGLRQPSPRSAPGPDAPAVDQPRPPRQPSRVALASLGPWLAALALAAALVPATQWAAQQYRHAARVAATKPTAAVLTAPRPMPVVAAVGLDPQAVLQLAARAWSPGTQVAIDAERTGTEVQVRLRLRPIRHGSPWQPASPPAGCRPVASSSSEVNLVCTFPALDAGAGAR